MFREIYYGEILLGGAEREQSGFDDLLDDLRSYRPKNPKCTKSRESLLINAKKSYGGRKMIIDAFRDKVFPLNNPNDFPHYVSEEDMSRRNESPSHSEDISPKNESPSHSEDKFNKIIIENDKTINKALFREYLKFQSLPDMQKSLSKTQNTQENKSSTSN